ncbi:MAG: peptidylprolyl isomerase [candidate division WOR-3 bacterium]|nr:peptidylprolyl isomerase [candidate division WOR-3 bacterium]MCX7947957.1 peptidylprolyl isomerase [candidate division WOR-3 bacterium]MDW8150901.1 peptidylprolyl isomerase [candidate division WOR-3 bacterium]
MESVKKDKIIEIEYQLKDENNEIIETSKTFTYLHGYNNIISELEKALEGLKVGEEKEIILTPDKAYGNYDIEKIQTIPIDIFEGVDIEENETYYAQTEDGQIVYFNIKKIDMASRSVMVDFNHPLAGKTLIFSIKVKNIRDATMEELERGRPN